MKEIAEIDAPSGEVWVSPPAIHPNFFELCDQFSDKPKTPLNPSENTADVSAEIIPEEAATNTTDVAP